MDTEDFYLGREGPETTLALGLCFGYEMHRGACDQELEPNETLCKRCREIERGYQGEAQEEAARQHRWAAKLFTDEEKELAKEEMDDAQRASFDQECAWAEFKAGLQTALQTQSAYALAERREDPDLPDIASRVMTWREGSSQTVLQIIDQCGKHDYNRAVYELWVLETAYRVRRVIRKLEAIPAEALTVYAKYIDFYDPDPHDGDDGTPFRQDEE